MIDHTPDSYAGFAPRGEVEALHQAFRDAMEDARKRAEAGHTSTAEQMTKRAENLKRLRNRILATMTDKDRASYPDYTPPD